jgi:hypothetical protein
MALDIITSPVRVRRFNVYDLEWKPGTLEVRIVGFFDGEHYRHYPTVKAFLRGELTSRNRGRWFYAHAGGLADVQFVLEALVEEGSYEVKASFSGSSAIIVHVKKGNNVWHFVDSYWLLRDKLANIGKVVGIEKAGPAGEDDWDDAQIKEWYASVSMEKLVWYNEIDCRILWTAIDRFETTLLELGGQLQMTLASCAMHLFRRHYLKHPIDTADSVNGNSKFSYFASRVEVFDYRPIEDAYYFDINSSFPYAMTQPVPGNLLCTTKNLPDDALYTADVDVEVPENYLTPLPVRMGGRVFFPTGKWRGWFTNIDLELLQEEGGRILKVHEAMVFEPFMDLASYATDLYTLRKNAQSEMEKVVLKLLLNSLYGKFAESDLKDSLHINPSAKTLARLNPEDMLFPGAWIETRSVDVPHVHVPISSHITAQARRTLYRFLARSNDFHYCDTDGFSTRTVFNTGKELGDLKLEKETSKGEVWNYVAPKVYRQGDKVKAKGFSLGYDEKKPKKKERAIARYEALVSNREIEVERMVRIRENFGKGRIAPCEKVIRKGLKGTSLTKRFAYPDGATRPWHIDELNAVFGMG